VIRACVDINVLVRGIAAQAGTASYAIYQAWLNRRFRLIVSRHILTGVRLALEDPYFATRVDQPTAGIYLARIWLMGEMTVLTVPVRGVAPDHEDDQVLSTAVSGRADFLVTDDPEFLAVQKYGSVVLVDSATFRRVLESAD